MHRFEKQPGFVVLQLRSESPPYAAIPIRDSRGSVIAIPWGYLTITVLAVVAALGAAAMVSARASTRPAVEELRDL